MKHVKVPQILEIEDISSLSVPARSQLYQLAPLGIGTPWIEGIFSYICRLANYHYVTPLMLAKWAIAQSYYSLADELLKSGKLKRRKKEAYCWNGAGESATVLVEAFTQLTQCRAVHLTTMLRYKNCIAPTSLGRKYRSWCPCCLQDWLDKGLTIYEPLVWNVNRYNICTKHKITLSSICPNCHKKLPVFVGRLIPGFCSKCSAWLGKSLVETEQINPMDCDFWISSAIEQMIEREEPIQRELSIKQMIQRGADELFDGCLAHWARHIRKSKTTVWTWVNEKHNLQLSDLLTISYAFQIPILDLMQGKSACWHKAKLTESPPSSYRHHGSKRIDWILIERYLERIIGGQICSVLSIEDIAKQFGISARRLRQIFPKKCKEISAKYKERISLESIERWKLVELMTRRAMVDLLHQGVKPTARLVMQKMNQRDIRRKDKRWQNLFTSLLAEMCRDGYVDIF